MNGCAGLSGVGTKRGAYVIFGCSSKRRRRQHLAICCRQCNASTVSAAVAVRGPTCPITTAVAVPSSAVARHDANAFVSGLRALADAPPDVEPGDTDRLPEAEAADRDASKRVADAARTGKVGSPRHCNRQLVCWGPGRCRACSLGELDLAVMAAESDAEADASSETVGDVPVPCAAKSTKATRPKTHGGRRSISAFAEARTDARRRFAAAAASATEACTAERSDRTLAPACASSRFSWALLAAWRRLYSSSAAAGRQEVVGHELHLEDQGGVGAAERADHARHRA